MPRLRIGIVGCGEVTQIIHLPALAQMPAEYEVTALCDVSEKVLAAVAARQPAASTYTDYRDLVSANDVDAVLIANPHAYHTTVAIAALQHGKHVMIEKPMSMTLAEADALAEAERTSGRIVQVGYMRRHAGAFVEAVKLIESERQNIRFARVHDFIGANQIIIDDTSMVVRDRNLPDASVRELKALNEGKLFEAIGTTDPALTRAYSLLLGLSSHDISAMRELLGRPQRVLNATQRLGGLCITATFDYGHFVCEFATGVDQIPRFDAFLEVYGEHRITRVDYDTPYIRNIPAQLTIVRAEGKAGLNRSVSYPSRLDSFVVEWKTFFDHVTNGTRPKTTVADSREDIEIFLEIMTHLKASAAEETDRVAS